MTDHVVPGQLLYAAADGDEPTVRALLEASTGLVNERGSNGETAIHLATANGHSRIVSMLIVAGADPGLCDRDGFTPLRLATTNCHSSCIEILVRSGANANCTDDEGHTALHLAADRANPTTVGGDAILFNYFAGRDTMAVLE